MPAKDTFHSQVRNALEKESWKITDDPLVLSLGIRTVFVDIGAEKLLGAMKNDVLIAVEIKSFLSQSLINDLEIALGQYQVYRFALQEKRSNRAMYLAIPLLSFEVIKNEPVLMKLLSIQHVNLLVFDPEREVIIEWLPSPLKKNNGSI